MTAKERAERAAEYEQLVSEIAKGICMSVPELHGLVPGSGRKNRILGASGYLHQIDVSLREMGHIFLIECKRWKKTIGVAEVLVLAGRASDIQACSPECLVTAIMVSVSGASRGAQKLARHFAIESEIATSPSEFGLRIGRFVHQAMSDGLRMTDHSEAAVIRKGFVLNE